MNRRLGSLPKSGCLAACCRFPFETPRETVAMPKSKKSQASAPKMRAGVYDDWLALPKSFRKRHYSTRKRWEKAKQVLGEIRAGDEKRGTLQNRVAGVRK